MSIAGGASLGPEQALVRMHLSPFSNLILIALLYFVIVAYIYIYNIYILYVNMYVNMYISFRVMSAEA